MPRSPSNLAMQTSDAQHRDNDTESADVPKFIKVVAYDQMMHIWFEEGEGRHVMQLGLLFHQNTIIEYFGESKGVSTTPGMNFLEAQNFEVGNVTYPFFWQANENLKWRWTWI